MIAVIQMHTLFLAKLSISKQNHFLFVYFKQNLKGALPVSKKTFKKSMEYTSGDLFSFILFKIIG